MKELLKIPSFGERKTRRKLLTLGVGNSRRSIRVPGMSSSWWICPHLRHRWGRRSNLWPKRFGSEQALRLEMERALSGEAPWDGDP